MSDIQTNTSQHQEAHDITLRRTLYAAGAGLIPLPIVDAAAILGVQVLMIRDIARVYGVEFKEHRVKSLVAALVGDVAAVGLFKFIPGLGTFFGGASAAAAGAATTYALGNVFAQHFDQGGTLSDFDPIKSKAFFQKEFEKGKTVVANLKKKAMGGKPGDENKAAALSDHDMLEQHKALHLEILALQREVAALRAPKTDLGNLQLVEGIGPKLEAALKAGGIVDLGQLAASEPAAIQAILDNAKGNFGLAVPDTWPQQAALAVQGDLEGLKALQAELFGGKKVNSL